MRPITSAWLYLPAFGCVSLARQYPCWGDLGSQHVSPCKAALFSLFPTRLCSGCGWPCISVGYIIWTWISSVILLTYIEMYLSAWPVISAVIFAVLVVLAQEYPWYFFYSVTFLKKTLNSNSIIQPVCIPPQPFITCTWLQVILSAKLLTNN